MNARAKIDFEEVEKLAARDCTEKEICYVLGISVRAFQNRKERDAELQESIDRGRSKGNASIRRKMFELAMNGDKTMLIWLSKNRLGYTDRTATELTGNPDRPIKIAADSLSDDELAAIIREGDK